VDAGRAGDRAFDLNYWKTELLQECERMEKELKALLVRKPSRSVSKFSGNGCST